MLTLFDNRSEFHWVGMASLEGQLEPFAEKRVTVHASFVGPHVYDLNRWRLTTGDFQVSPSGRHWVVIQST